MNDDRFTIIPKASIRPNKIVFYKQFIRKEVATKPQKPLNNSAVLPVFPLQVDLFAPPEREKFANLVTPDKNEKTTTKQVVVCNKHHFELSKKAKSAFAAQL